MKVINISQELAGPLRLEMNLHCREWLPALFNTCVQVDFQHKSLPINQSYKFWTRTKWPPSPPLLLRPLYKLLPLHPLPTNAGFLSRWISQSLGVPFTDMFLYCYRGICAAIGAQVTIRACGNFKVFRLTFVNRRGEQQRLDLHFVTSLGQLIQTGFAPTSLQLSHPAVSQSILKLN